MRFLHVMIRVQDIEASLKFYTELFDMNLTHTVDLVDSTLYYLSDEDGQTQIELTYNLETPLDGYTNGDAFGHLAFGIDSFDEFTPKMEALGYFYTVEPYYLKEVDSTIAFLNDPDGNEIEVMV